MVVFNVIAFDAIVVLVVVVIVDPQNAPLREAPWKTDDPGKAEGGEERQMIDKAGYTTDRCSFR